MEMELVKTFRFEAAHWLPCVPDGHKCKNLHGHSYRVDIHVTGSPAPDTGWVVDFGDIKNIVSPIIDELDHKCLNDIAELPNSTSEMICVYLWDRIKPQLGGLSAITLWESDSSRCIFHGPSAD